MSKVILFSWLVVCVSGSLVETKVVDGVTRVYDHRLRAPRIRKPTPFMISQLIEYKEELASKSRESALKATILEATKTTGASEATGSNTPYYEF